MKPPGSGHYRIRCDRVFDPLTRRFEACCIEVRGGVFASVEPLGPESEGPESEPARDGVEVLDLRGLTLLPPLVDPHLHLCLEPWPLDPRRRGEPGRGPGGELERARARATGALLAGVGVIRDLGEPDGINLALAEASATDRRLPRIVASGPAFHREGRYGRFLGRSFTTLESLRAGIREVAADPRCALIKLVPTGIINLEKGKVTSRPQLTAGELEAAVGLAHELGKKVSAHASGEEGVRLAVEAGADFIEHGYFMSRDTVELLVEKGLTWTPTLAPVHVQWSHAASCGHDEATRGRLRGILDEHARMLRLAHSLGARLLAGSDGGSPGVSHGGGVWRELQLMQAAGLPAPELLAMATGRAAEALGLGERAGRIAPGRAADFIVGGGAVASDLGDLAEIRWVARDGEILEARRPRLESDEAAPRYGMPSELKS